MLYKKPDNMKYTDMCIYCDGVIAKDNPTQSEIETLFEYTYHIAFMLAHKHKFFKYGYYYEEFALYFALELLYRFIYNPKLKQLDAEGNPKLPKVKSVLNYMKASIYGGKIRFEQEQYCQKVQPLVVDKFNLNTTLAEQMERASGDNIQADLSLYVRYVGRTVKHVVYRKSPYKHDKLLMKNIYTSCLLTINNMLTFTSTEVDRILNTYTHIESKYKFIERMYLKNRQTALILYHLDSSYSDYISVLVRKILNTLKKDIQEISSSYTYITEDVLSDIIFNELDGKLDFS